MGDACCSENGKKISREPPLGEIQKIRFVGGEPPFSVSSFRQIAPVFAEKLSRLFVEPVLVFFGINLVYVFGKTQKRRKKIQENKFFFRGEKILLFSTFASQRMRNKLECGFIG